MADPYTSGGYPVGPLERFVTGLESGYTSALDIKKKSQELKTALAYEEAANAKPKRAVGGEGDTGTTREKPYETGGTTGSGGSEGGGSGGSGKGGGGSGEGGWGEYAAPIADYFKKAGYSDAAIQGIMANGLAEGGFRTNWNVGDNGASKGHWQFNAKGEMPGYETWAKNNGVTDLQNSVNQARYVDYRLQSDPKFKNFKNITDAKEATNRFHIDFERPKDQTPGLRFGHLATAQRYLAGGGAPAPAAAPAIGSGSSTAPAPAPAPALTQKQQYDADLAAGRRPTFPPDQKFNSRGEAISTAVGYTGPQATNFGPAPTPAPIMPWPTPAPAAEPAPAEPAPAAAPAAAPPSALQLPPVPSYGGDLQKIQAPQGLRPPAPAPAASPQQQSAIGDRPQAPPPPSVLAQLVQQNPYLPQQIAALRQARRGVPQSALYSGFA